MTTTTTTTHVRIHGRVHGVGYRAWTQSLAEELNLTGWIRNRRDGTVEAVFQGPRAAVDEMLPRCKTGPSGAAVTRVEVIGEGVAAFAGFEVRPTA